MNGSLDLSQFEPLLPDDRVAKVAERVRSEFGHGNLEGADFVTFVQQAKEITRDVNGVTVRSWIPEMAVFAVISDNPRAPKGSGQRLMTHGTAALEDWRDSEKELGHYASDGRDPAHNIFRGVVREHLRVIQNLKEMI